jgi:hypothetical protein
MLALIHKIPSTESSFLGLRSWLCSKPQRRRCRNSLIHCQPPMSTLSVHWALVWKWTFIAAIGFGTAREASIDLEINTVHETYVGVKHHLTIVIATFSSSILWWPTISVAHHLVACLDSSFGTSCIHHTPNRIVQSVNIWVIQIKAATWTHRCPASRVEMHYAMRGKSHGSSNKLCQLRMGICRGAHYFVKRLLRCGA